MILNDMVIQKCPITVFTKPWKKPGIVELAEIIGNLGFNGVELAVRPGYQVEPENALAQLPEAARIFEDNGLKIESIAADMTPGMIEACATADVPVLRTMLKLDPELGYHASVQQFRDDCLALKSTIQGTQVKIGLQNHCGHFVGSAIGLMEAIAPLPDYVVAVLDLAHTALAGELEPYALEIAKPRLAMVNLKNATYVPGERNEHGEMVWTHSWVQGKDGLTSWSLVVDLLNKHNYTGPICLTAEYKNDQGQPVTEEATIPWIRKDLDFLKSLL